MNYCACGHRWCDARRMCKGVAERLVWNPRASAHVNVGEIQNANREWEEVWGSSVHQHISAFWGQVAASDCLRRLRAGQSVRFLGDADGDDRPVIRDARGRILF